jgi:hypothetical protein
MLGESCTFSSSCARSSVLKFLSYSQININMFLQKTNKYNIGPARSFASLPTDDRTPEPATPHRGGRLDRVRRARPRLLALCCLRGAMPWLCHAAAQTGGCRGGQHGGVASPTNAQRCSARPSILYVILYPLYPLWDPLVTYLNISMCDLVLKDLLRRI